MSEPALNYIPDERAAAAIGDRSNLHLLGQELRAGAQQGLYLPPVLDRCAGIAWRAEEDQSSRKGAEP